MRLYDSCVLVSFSFVQRSFGKDGAKEDGSLLHLHSVIPMRVALTDWLRLRWRLISGPLVFETSVHRCLSRCARHSRRGRPGLISLPSTRRVRLFGLVSDNQGLSLFRIGKGLGRGSGAGHWGVGVLLAFGYALVTRHNPLHHHRGRRATAVSSPPDAMAPLLPPRLPHYNLRDM